VAEPIGRCINRGAAADVARHAGAVEGAGFISWRGRDHGQFWELGVGLFYLLYISELTGAKEKPVAVDSALVAIFADFAPARKSDRRNSMSARSAAGFCRRLG
jgi:hypothetical protein